MACKHGGRHGMNVLPPLETAAVPRAGQGLHRALEAAPGRCPTPPLQNICMMLPPSLKILAALLHVLVRARAQQAAAQMCRSLRHQVHRVCLTLRRCWRPHFRGRSNCQMPLQCCGQCMPASFSQHCTVQETTFTTAG